MPNLFRTRFFALQKHSKLFTAEVLSRLPGYDAKKRRTEWKDNLCASAEDLRMLGARVGGDIVYYDRRSWLEKGTPSGSRDEVLSRDGEDGIVADVAFVLDAKLHVLAVHAHQRLAIREATRLFRQLLDEPSLILAIIKAPDKEKAYEALSSFKAVDVHIAGLPVGETTVAQGIRSAVKEMNAQTVKLHFEGTPSEPLSEKVVRYFINNERSGGTRHIRKLKVRGVIPKEDHHQEVLLDMLSGIVEDAQEMSDDVDCSRMTREHRVRMVNEALDRHGRLIQRAVWGGK